MQSRHILIVDDDIKICHLLKKLLNNHGYKSIYTNSAQEAKIIINYLKFDIILVDYMMPEEDGVSFINYLIEYNNDTPTLMVSAVDEIDNKILALKQGARDYITKPFNSEELILRIDNIISLQKYSYKEDSDTIIQGNVQFNTKSNNLIIDGQQIELSNYESIIFKLLITNTNKIILKEEILKHLGKTISEANLMSLSVGIMRLRKKVNIKNKLIKTARGKGFVFQKD